ncbi:EAL domain-containing protein [Methylonatrum kenyense]|uniref:EAL domain-containing protein n=1 Tax=Methylonatrum kenyense TaxID=455253 RepID=UPI0020BEB3D8|nr:EAL domain-containing protein [Methylonatrum kenyense]MCK8516010.1 EAL domain-containing protein [Methylonatrum kenyense]
MACIGCEVVPSLPQGDIRLYLAPKLAHTRAVAARGLRDAGWIVEDIDGAVLVVKVADGQSATLLDDLDQVMTSPEQSNCPAVMLDPGQPFGIRQLADTTPLRVLIARQKSAWLSELLTDERLEMHFQPILHADGGGVFAFESLVRGIGADGKRIPPNDLFGAAREADLLFHLDRAARVAAIRQAHGAQIDETLFINFNPTSVYEPSFCLKTTFDAVNAIGTCPANYVFEVVETDHISDHGHLKNILAEYRNHGFRIALDDLGAGYSSLNLLQGIRPDFVKLDREMVDGVSGSRYLASITSRLISMARELDVQLIAEGIENREDWEWLQEQGVDYVQGFYFARPSATPERPAMADLAR